MGTANLTKAHFIFLYLICLLSLTYDTVNCTVVVSVRRQSPDKYRQNEICLNHAAEEFVEHPENCRLFYLCKADGQAIIASCPPTMLFNPESKICDKATNVQCRQDGLFSTTATSATTIPAADDNEVDDAMRYCSALSTQQEINRLTFLDSMSSCKRYYVCYYGRALLQECSDNLHWNSNIGKCDLPANAGCRLIQQQQQPQQNNNNYYNNNGVNENGAISGDQFINCPNYGIHIFPHLGRCDFFIYCVKGHATLQQCPFYYYFDIITKNCKWRTTAICIRDLNIDFQI